jgi:ADP-ribose pyrophosphatase
VKRDRTVHRGRLIDLRLVSRRLPNGRVAELELIRHPGAVLIVPFIGSNRIVLIRQYRPVIGSYIWELPAGTLKRGERPLACAKRELEEEIGYVAREWRHLGWIVPAPGYTTERIHLFAARGLGETRCRREDDEVIRARVFSFRCVVSLLRSRRIVDAKTIAALVRAGVL